MAKKKTVSKKKATGRQSSAGNATRKKAGQKKTVRKGVKRTAKKKTPKKKASRKKVSKKTARKPAKKAAATGKSASGARLGRARITGDVKLDEFFKRDYEARQVFEFLQVHTLKELEQFGPDEIIERLTGPMLRTIDRIRKALALNNRSLKDDERFAVDFLTAIGGPPRTRRAAAEK